MRLKIRHRAPPPLPWKWEIHVGQRLVTASHDGFATQEDAHRAGRIAIDRIILDHARVAKQAQRRIVAHTD